MDHGLLWKGYVVRFCTFLLESKFNSIIAQVLITNDSAIPLTPPPIGPPTITYTTAGGRSGNAEFISDSSYQLTDPVENDVYTFNVTVTNVAGSTSVISEEIRGIDHLAIIIIAN